MPMLFGNAFLTIIAWTKFQLKYQIQLLVYKKNALMSGLLAKKTPNASLLSKTAKRSAELAVHAGPSAFQQKEAKLQSTLQNVLKNKTV